MKIILCGSISAARDILRVKTYLQEKKGVEVEIPEGVKHLGEWEGEDAAVSEKANRKIKLDLIRGYYEKMKSCDAALIVNPEKKGVRGYIGGNTLIEMAFAHVLNKKLYCLYPLPDIAYRPELEAMQPVILDDNLDRIV